jgi:thiol-disulfide isomerase/thioredoxin
MNHQPPFMGHSRANETFAKWKSQFLAALVCVISVLATTSLVQGQRGLPGCEPALEVRRIIDKKLNGEGDNLRFADRVARDHAIYEELIAKYPREAEPYRLLIAATRFGRERQLDPSQYPALQERFRKASAENPNDALALYVAGMALFETDTPESLRLLELAKTQAPRFPWPALELALEYSSGKRMDKQKSSENLATFFASCPDSTDARAQYLLSTEAPLQPRVAAALRVRLAHQSDLAHLKDYGVLWSLEFRTRPPQEHWELRKEIAKDLRRLESLNANPDPEWQAFLINGYKQAGVSSEIITSMEDHLLSTYPHSNQAYKILSTRWYESNKEPKDQKDLGAWAKYDEMLKKALSGWIRDFPNMPSIVDSWFDLISSQDSLTEEEGIAEMERYLRYRTEYVWPSAQTDFQVADCLLRRKWEPMRALGLLEQARAMSDKERALQLANDNLPTEKERELSEWYFNRDRQLVHAILRAAQLTHQPNAVTAIRALVEGSPPIQKELQSDYWWNRARLAVLDGRQPDALAYYQQALNSRLVPPQYFHGELLDDLTREALALWNELGGTLPAWAVWNGPPSLKDAKIAQGEWEQPRTTLVAFELSDLAGKIWRLKDLQGKAVLINVWATWCGPCNAELPNLQNLYEHIAQRSDIQILTFDMDEDLGLVGPYLKDKGYTFPVIPAYSLVNNLLEGSVSLPQSWIVDSEGNWRWTQKGYGAESNWQQVMMQKLESAKRTN